MGTWELKMIHFLLKLSLLDTFHGDIRSFSGGIFCDLAIPTRWAPTTVVTNGVMGPVQMAENKWVTGKQKKT